jgi:hypothetical protein
MFRVTILQSKSFAILVMLALLAVTVLFRDFFIFESGDVAPLEVELIQDLSGSVPKVKTEEIETWETFVERGGPVFKTFDELSIQFENFDEFSKYYTLDTGRSPPKALKGWFDFAKNAKCSLSQKYYSRIERDLKPFRDQGGISVDEMKIAGTHGCSFAILNHSISAFQGNQVYGEFYHQDHSYRPILEPIAHFLPDLSFVFNIIDECKVANLNRYNISGYYHTRSDAEVARILNGSCSPEEFEYAKSRHGFFIAPVYFQVTVPDRRVFPVFSQGKVETCFSDILMPSYYYVDEMHSADPFVIDWENKTETQLFWRGTGSGGCLYSECKWEATHRYRLMREYFKGHPKWDVGIPEINPHEPELLEHTEKYVKVGYCNFGDHFKYKYLLDIDGNSFSRRFLPFLKSKSLVFRGNIYKVFFEDFVRPYEHYIPIDMDYQDIEEKLDWIMEHDIVAKSIAYEAYKLATTYLRLEDLQCYVGRLLVEYQTLLEDPTFNPHQ